MRLAIIVFPGTNCDLDCFDGLTRVMGQRADFVWHRETSLEGFDAVVLPGGFSYGDYLRTGAIARFSPIMAAVRAFAQSGRPVLGICNGFQILAEAGLLPGALLTNSCLQFRCQWTQVRVENAQTLFTLACQESQVLRLPINHYEGRYYAPPETLAELEAHGQILLRYCTPEGAVLAEANPNGSLGNIAGIMNREGNVFGLMPHPERAMEREVDGEDGRFLFQSLLSAGSLRR